MTFLLGKCCKVLWWMLGSHSQGACTHDFVPIWDFIDQTRHCGLILFCSLRLLNCHDYWSRNHNKYPQQIGRSSAPMTWGLWLNADASSVVFKRTLMSSAFVSVSSAGTSSVALQGLYGFVGCEAVEHVLKWGIWCIQSPHEDLGRLFIQLIWDIDRKGGFGFYVSWAWVFETSSPPPLQHLRTTVFFPSSWGFHVDPQCDPSTVGTLLSMAMPHVLDVGATPRGEGGVGEWCNGTTQCSTLAKGCCFAL